jgi:long-chain acyl-CoA synthetase
VDALYGGAQTVQVETEFKYQDGSVQKVATEVRVLEAAARGELAGGYVAR